MVLWFAGGIEICWMQPSPGQLFPSISPENRRNSGGFHYFLRVYYNDSGNEEYASVKIIYNILQ